MLPKKTLIALVAILSWVAASESLFLAGTAAVAGATVATAVTVAGIATLKGALILWAALGSGNDRRQNQNHKRSIGIVMEMEEDEEMRQHLRDGENLILSTIGRFDPDGCIFKLLCHLQVKDKTARTIEENLLVKMFSNNTDIAKDYNADFVNAAVIGGTYRDDRACSVSFPKCPLSVVQLESLVRDAWGCGP